MKRILVLCAILVVGTMAIASVVIKDKTGAYLGSQSEIKCAYGLDCNVVAGTLVLKPSLGVSSDATATFASGDTTPAVDVGGPFFKTFLNNTVSITDFDGSGIYAGQEITVMSQGAVTIDVTSSGIICGTTDLVMVSGDISKYMYDGGDWRCTSYVDQTDNLN